MRILLLIILSFGFVAGYAQDATPLRDNAFAPTEQEQTTTQKKVIKKKSKKSYRALWNKRMDRKVEEFYALMKKNAKENTKIAKKMEKPQYSDPMYFGHKRKPKKRPVGKTKFCKECHIRH